MPMICPGCERGVRAKDATEKAIMREGAWWHRPCALKESGEYALIAQLFNMQDDPDVDPTTAMADLIGQIGHFATAHNKGRRKYRIDFEDAVRRGLNYWREETQ